MVGCFYQAPIRPDYEVKMKNLLMVLSLVVSSLAFANGDYPTSPDPRLTPGSVCTKPSSHRYPEQINYCERNVESSLKREIMKRYDRELGYNITRMDRMQFKIDHYIPLCMGGSNDETNLWPQHRTVYERTDELEFTLCEKMKEGRLKQSAAIQYIKRAKIHLEEAEAILHEVSGL